MAAVPDRFADEISLAGPPARIRERLAAWKASPVTTHPLVARLVRHEHLATIENLVRRRGAWAVFVARFVLGTRMATFLSAGAFGMPLGAFAVAEGAGTMLFVAAAVWRGLAARRLARQ